MGDGLRRAAASAKATRQAECPECGRTVTIRVNAMIARIPPHGPKAGPCPGSGKRVA